MRHNGVIWSLLAALILPFAARAADLEIPYIEGQKPPVSGTDECWCVVLLPAQTRTETIQVCVSPARCDFETLPAVYDTRIDRVCVKPASQRPIEGAPEFRTEKIQVCVKPEVCQKEYVPPVFETREESICIRPPYSKKITVPAVYKEVSEQVCVQPASSGWRQVECQGVEVSLRPAEAKDACWCFVTTPAKFETVTKRVLCEPEKCHDEVIPGEYRTIKKQVKVREESWKPITTPPQYETVERQVLCATPVKYETIPAEYKEVQSQICVQPERKKRIDIPAKYETQTREVTVCGARKVWRKVACKTNGHAIPATNSKDENGETSQLPLPFPENKPKPVITKLPITEVPPAVLEAAKTWSPSAAWAADVEVENLPNKAPVYVLSGAIESQTVTIKIGENGSIIKADRLPEKASARPNQ